MSRTKYEIDGLKELDRFLARFPDRLRKKVLKGALRDSAKPTLRDARSRMPKRTGLSAKDLKIRSVPQRDTYLGPVQIAIAGSRAKGGRDYILRFIERGTEKMAPQPFFRPAVDTTAEQSFKLFMDAIRKRGRAEIRKMTR